jgi:hypothetical protein
MSGIKYALLAGTIFSLGACTPMDQSALVYSSAQSVGIKAASGTADSPGAKLIFGYDQLDAAYVPVMVGRHCSDGADCNSDPYRLHPIVGRNTMSNEIGDNDPVRKAGEAFERAMQEAEEKKKIVDSQKAEITSAKERRIQLDKDIAAAKAAALADPAISDGPSPEAKLAALQTDWQRLDERIPQAEKELTAQELSFAQAEANRDAAGQRYLTELKKQGRIADADIKEDAFSVFGRFNTNAKINLPKATDNASDTNIALGKVFSTGVAAQFLTQGIATAACLEQGAQLMEYIVGEDEPSKKQARNNAAQKIIRHCTADDTAPQQ